MFAPPPPLRILPWRSWQVPKVRVVRCVCADHIILHLHDDDLLADSKPATHFTGRAHSERCTGSSCDLGKAIDDLGATNKRQQNDQ